MRPDLALLAAHWRAAFVAEQEAAVGLRKDLHADPRASADEDDASRRIEAALHGVIAFRRSADTGRIGRIGPERGAAIALRAELDALPLREQTGAPYAATGELMHACGHDVHQAALVALLRASVGIDLPFGLVALLQPREETYPSGALDMVRENVLLDEDIAHVIGAHVHPAVPVGEIAVGGGFINAAADEIDIRLVGRGGHGAYPHDGADPVAAAAHIAIALPELVRRTVSPLNAAVISIGTLHVGDGAANVLPENAHIRATLRSTDPADRVALQRAVKSTAESIASGFGVVAVTTVTEGEPVLINDAELAARIGDAVVTLGVSRAEPLRSLGADDFSYFSDAVPSAMLFVGVETAGETPPPSLHHPRFLPTDRAVQDVGMALMAGYLAAAENLLDARPSAITAPQVRETLTAHPSIEREHA